MDILLSVAWVVEEAKDACRARSFEDDDVHYR